MIGEKGWFLRLWNAGFSDSPGHGNGEKRL